MKKLMLTLCLCALLVSPILLNAQKTLSPDMILGIWYNAEKDAKIEVYKDNNSYYGKVIWLKYPNDSNGKPKTDIENPDPKLKSRPRLNLVVLNDLKSDGKGAYEKGKIYDPKSGKTYSCQAEFKGKDVLALRGFIGVSLIGKTSQWTRTK